MLRERKICLGKHYIKSVERLESKFQSPDG